jgi:hypothetical protein
MHLHQENTMTSSIVCHRSSAKLYGWAIRWAIRWAILNRKGYTSASQTAAACLILASILTPGILTPGVPIKAAEKLPIAQAKGTVSTSEFDLAGVNFYTLETDVVELLGPPKSRDIAPTSYIDEVLYYGGISIAITGGQVWDIVATSPKFCTPSGVCPGDSVDYVFSILGPTDITQSGDRQTATYTAPEMSSCSLELDIVADTVNQITITCP